MPRPLPFDLPDLSDPAVHQRHLKERLAAAFRLFGRFGFDEGPAGHITARDPLRPDHLWVNPFGMNFKQIRVSDLILVGPEGDVVEGDWPVNRAAYAIHHAVHEARPDVWAAAHTHSKYGRAFSALARPLSPISQDACAFHGDHAVFDDYTGVVNDPDEGKRLAVALGEHKAVILRNHGLLTVGASVDAAAWWYISMERSCEVQLSAMAAGEMVMIDDDVATATQADLGNEIAGLFSFHPLWSWIIDQEPDLLD